MEKTGLHWEEEGGILGQRERGNNGVILDHHDDCH